MREREREEWRVGTECSLKSVAASRRGLSSWAAWKHFTNTHTHTHLLPLPHTHAHTTRKINNFIRYAQQQQLRPLENI